MLVRFCGIWTLTGLVLTVFSGYWYMGSIPAEQVMQVVNNSAMIMLVVSLMFYGSFEFMREAGRKPYVVWGEVYSTNITVEQEKKMHGESILQNAKWIPQDLREITDQNRLKAGSWLYQMECGPCHAINGPMNDI
ncbi:cytochrome ubiquinol oxidase subunit I, partial [Aduncisulcus paluster]